MEKKDLQKVADSVFERYKRIDKVFITSDGQAFFEEAYAKNHAAAKDLDVETFRRDKETDLGDFDLDAMDRVQLEAFIKDNKLKVKFDEKVTDENLRKAITGVLNSSAKKATK